MAATTRVIRFAGAGGPDVIRLEEAPMPALRPGTVLIRTAYAGVNRPDCLQRAGLYPPPPGAGDIPGLEVAGTVLAAAEDVAWPKPGARVAALLADGGYADHALAEAALCLPVPEGFGFAEAAGLPETAFTVYDNIVTRGRLKAGETVLVHGGSSGIGSFAIQLARALGARVFATAGSAEKCAFCRDLGAALAINYREADFVERARAETGGTGVDLILDMVGGDYVARNLALLAPEGRLVQIAFPNGSRVEVDLRVIMMRRLTVTGSTLRPRTVAQKAEIAARLRAEVWPLLEAGRIRTVVDAVFPLAQAAEAHRLMESSAHMGKILLAAAGAGED